MESDAELLMSAAKETGLKYAIHFKWVASAVCVCVCVSVVL